MTPPSIPDYTYRALIGEGSTGRVYAAEYGGQALMALKVFDSDLINRQLISDALVKIFNREEHEGIVAVHDFDLASAQAYMATSLHGDPYQAADGQEAFHPRTISGLMGHLMPEDAWQYAQQIAEALAFLHRQRVIHCNLQPSNVMLDGSTPPHIKLTDFSQGLLGAVPKLIPGDAVFYAAPEQIRQPEHYFGGRAERWDVYAFGVLTYQLLTGEYPRLASAITEIKKREAAALDLHFSYDYKVLADLIEDQAAYEWPSPAADDDESARRAIIDRCLQVKPEDRYADMREVLLALQALEDDANRREEHRKFAAEQLRLDKKVSGMKKIAALLGVLALGGLGGTAYLSQRSAGDGSGDPDPESPVSLPPIVGPVSPLAPTISESELAELKLLLANSMEYLRNSQSALDEVFRLVIARDDAGNPKYDLPEGSPGILLNYYEDFAAQHAANPQLALEVVRAEGNAGLIHLRPADAETATDSESAREHFERAIAKVKLMRSQTPEDKDKIGLDIAAAALSGYLSEALAIAGRDQAAADAAMESYRLWEGAQQANPGSLEATTALAKSLLDLAERMHAIERPVDTGLYAQRAKIILKGLEADDKVSEEDIVALSRCDHMLGKSERAKANLSDAIDRQLDAVERLLSLKISSPDPPRGQRYTLAIYYGELADTIADFGNRESAAEANDEAVKLLVDLVAEAPSSVEYPFQLARRYTTRAALLRDEGKGKEALAAQLQAIDINKELTSYKPPPSPRSEIPRKINPNRYDISYELALEFGDMMDLYDEAGKKQEVIDIGDEAVKLMHDLLNEDLDKENGDSKRIKYREGYADLQIRLAQHLEKYGQKEFARKYYDRGATQLQSLIDAGRTTEEITKALAAAEAKVKALGG